MNIGPEASIELVVTVPESLGPTLLYQLRCRTTVGALTQILVEAECHVVIAAPFMQTGYGLSAGALFDALRAALNRGVNIDILSTGRGLQSIDREFLSSGARGRLRFFQPTAHLVDEQQLGSHAKFCVGDGRLAYVGSANLTGKGLSGQFEIGVLVAGPIARQIAWFWDDSVTNGLFVEAK